MITLRLISHELEKYGLVIQGDCDPSQTYQGARLLFENASDDRFIYVCDSSTSLPSRSDEQTTCIYVHDTKSAEDEETKGNPAIIFTTQLSLHQVFSLLQDVFQAYNDWERNMDASVIHNEGVQSLLDISSGFIVNHIAVVDPALKLLAYSKDVPCDDPVTLELIKYGYHTEENIRKFKLNKRFHLWSKQTGFIINESYQICKYVTVVHAFKTQDSFSMIVVMMCNKSDPEEYVLDVFKMLLNRVEHYAKREYPEDKPAGNMTDSFLRDLLDDKIPNDAAIAERCKFVGIPLVGMFCLFSIHIGTGSDNPNARVLAEITKTVAPAKTLLYQDAVIVLCFNCNNNACSRKCSTGTCPAQRLTITRRLEEILQKYDLFCGRSGGFTSLSNVHRAFLQAQASLTIGLKKEVCLSSGKPSEKHIFNFDDYYIDYMREKSIEQGEDLIRATWGCQVLDTISRYDKEHNTDNYNFLFCFLLYERRSSIIAEQLHMHRNNIKYRIDRIEAIFGINTEDPVQRYDLFIAYKILGEPL